MYINFVSASCFHARVTFLVCIRAAQSETDEEALKDEMAQEYKQLQRQNADNVKKHKNKGIRRFFGK